jgi:hypothetical protein
VAVLLREKIPFETAKKAVKLVPVTTAAVVLTM